MQVLKSIVESSPNIDYFTRLLTGKLGVPLNGQKYRIELFNSIIDTFNFDAVVETGTNRGSTTEFIAERFSGPIFSIESMKKYADFSKIRVGKYSNVEIITDDSVNGLRKVLSDSKLSGKTVLFYLDAHWYDYLPLRDELELILHQHSDLTSVIMIDDFAVPGDHDYGFDSYKAGTLNFQYIESVLTSESSVFFPSTPGRLETGFKQGCVVLSSNSASKQKLHSISLLNEFAK